MPQPTPPIIVTPEQRDKISAFIRDLTGAKGIFIILIPEKSPCPEKLRGEKCYGHHSTAFSDGIEADYLPNVLEMAKEQISGSVPSKFI